MDTIRKVQAYRSGTVVLRDIDSGRESGFWLVPMTDAELESWWHAQPTFDQNPNGALDDLHKVFGQIPPPHSVIVLPGELLMAESDRELALWMRMAADKTHYLCNICCDTDSYLRRPDGTVLYHRGFVQKPPATKQ